MKTQTQLCERALSKVEKVGSGQTASAEDIAVAQLVLNPMIDELSALGVCDVVLTSDTSAEEIPNELFNGLAALLALDIASDFGLPAPSDEARQNVMNIIRRIAALRPTYETLAAEYY